MTNTDDIKHRSILREIAHRVMLERGLAPDFPNKALAELDRIHGPATGTEASIRDLFHRGHRNGEAFPDFKSQYRNIEFYCPVNVCRDYLYVVDFLEHDILRLFKGLMGANSLPAGITYCHTQHKVLPTLIVIVFLEITLKYL